MLVVSVGEKGCTEPGSNTQAVDIFAQEATKIPLTEPRFLPGLVGGFFVSICVLNIYHNLSRVVEIPPGNLFVKCHSSYGFDAIDHLAAERADP